MSETFDPKRAAPTATVRWLYPGVSYIDNKLVACVPVRRAIATNPTSKEYVRDKFSTDTELFPPAQKNGSSRVLCGQVPRHCRAYVRGDIFRCGRQSPRTLMTKRWCVLVAYRSVLPVALVCV